LEIWNLRGFGFGLSFSKQDATLRRRHLAVEDSKEHSFDGSFLETGHVAPPNVLSIALCLDVFFFGPQEPVKFFG